MKYRSLLLLVMAASLTLAGDIAWAQTDDTDTEAPKLTPAPPVEVKDGGDKTDDKAGDDKTPTTQDSDSSGDGGRGDPFGGYFIWIMLGGLVLMWVWMGRSRKKQAAKRQEMLGALKKGMKATTIGGIIGTVVEVRENLVVLKVDDSKDIRMRFTRRAIGAVGEPAKGDGDGLEQVGDNQ